MLRKFITTLSAFTLVLSLGLWGLSYLRLHTAGHGPLVNVDLTKGCLFIGDYGMLGPGGQRAIRRRAEFFGFRGFKTQWTPDWNSASSPLMWYIMIPLWIPAWVSAGLLTPAGIHGMRRWRRKKNGQCVECGYDLRGSRSRCPECGSEFEPVADR